MLPASDTVTPMNDAPAPTAAIGKGYDDEATVPGRIVRSWALWDWATQPFNSVILTFVWVSLYLVSDSFLPDSVAAPSATPETSTPPMTAMPACGRPACPDTSMTNRTIAVYVATPALHDASPG